MSTRVQLAEQQPGRNTRLQGGARKFTQLFGVTPRPLQTETQGQSPSSPSTFREKTKKQTTHDILCTVANNLAVTKL